MTQFSDVTYTGTFSGSGAGTDDGQSGTAGISGSVTAVLSEAADGSITGTYTYSGDSELSNNFGSIAGPTFAGGGNVSGTQSGGLTFSATSGPLESGGATISSNDTSITFSADWIFSSGGLSGSGEASGSLSGTPSSPPPPLSNLLSTAENLFPANGDYVYFSQNGYVGGTGLAIHKFSGGVTAKGVGIDCSNLVYEALLGDGYDVPYLPTSSIMNLTGPNAGTLNTQTLAPQYYQTVTTPGNASAYDYQPGDIIFFDGPKGGHMGIVESYNSSTGFGTFYGSQSSTGPDSADFTTNSNVTTDPLTGAKINFGAGTTETLVGAVVPLSNAYSPDAASAALSGIRSITNQLLLELQNLQASDPPPLVTLDPINPQLAPLDTTSDVPDPTAGLMAETGNPNVFTITFPSDPVDPGWTETVSMTNGTFTNVSGAVLTSGSEQVVSSGGTATDTTIDSGGEQVANSGATCTETSLHGGTVTIAGGFVEFTSGSNTGTVTFQGGGEAEFEQPSTFTATLADLSTGDILDFSGLSVASGVIQGTTLDATETNGQVVRLQVSDPGFIYFSVQPDGNGGTELVATPFATPLSAAVDGVYQSVLQRTPSGAEVTAATSLDTTVGAAGVIASVVDSPEAQFNVYPIVQIIELATGSLPTAAQLAGWVPFVETAGLLQGQSQTNPLLDQMAEAFVASTQFGNTYNGGTAVDPNATITAAIVSAIIQAATGIAATQTQINAWVGTGLSVDQVFVDFSLGDQYSAHLLSNVQHFLTTVADQAVSTGGLGITDTITPNDGLTSPEVQKAYKAVLQRDPTGAETNTALSIDSSVGNVAALAAIADSPEAQQYVYPVTQIILLATGNLPTAGQLAGWVPAVESGTSLDQMALAFVASTAFGDTYNGGTAVDPDATITATIVSAIIQAATGIAATQTQINAWLGTGQTIDQVFVDFALGDQYTAHIQSTVQNDLTAAAINGAGLSTVDGINATGALTLGTMATPLTGNDLIVLGGSGALTVVAAGNGDTIAELNTSIAGGTITANGAGDSINAANGANTITANGSGDTIILGTVSTGTVISAVQTIHASGVGDTISFATKAADGTAVNWTSASTVDGGSATTGIGANSTVNFGNNTGSGSETAVLTGDLTGATTQNSNTTSGIAMIALGNVHDAAGDQIIFNNATTEVLAGTSAVNVTGASSLAQAFDLAAAAAATSQGGTIAAHTGVIDWFQYGGSTYALEAINATASAATHPALAATDEAIKIVGAVNLGGESLSVHTLTL